MQMTCFIRMTLAGAANLDSAFARLTSWDNCSILERRRCNGDRCMPSTRRELLCAGGLSLLGLTTEQLARLRADFPGDATQRRQHACVFVFLFGGPSHIDL